MSSPTSHDQSYSDELIERLESYRNEYPTLIDGHIDDLKWSKLSHNDKWLEGAINRCEAFLSFCDEGVV